MSSIDSPVQGPPHVETYGSNQERTESGRRHVLCFDGTDNQFNADETDTNIVKLYEMLDRSTSDQFHYYQPGIGTWVEGEYSTPTSVFGKLKTSISEMIDEGFGTSFVHHVLGGYKFLLRYYAEGDKIYIFGFSRGAYTARFLSEMIDNVGLLSRGNDEMIRFAWKAFSDYQRAPGKLDLDEKRTVHKYHGAGRLTKRLTENQSKRERREQGKMTKQEAKDYMDIFKSTFCRDNCRVHFLGLFDCVNSVSQFETHKHSTPFIPKAPATHIRHAVSINERRCKFKPYLFLINSRGNKSGDTLNEVWFAGNHGDVGGGWALETEGKRMSSYLLSDIALGWMVEEVRKTDAGGANVIRWKEASVKAHKQHALDQTHTWNLSHLHEPTAKAEELEWLRKHVHDPLRYGGGQTSLKTFRWRILELFPFSHWDLVNDDTPGHSEGDWSARWWPANFGSERVIPEGAHFHPSVHQLFDNGILEDLPEPREAVKTFWIWRLAQFALSKEISKFKKPKAQGPIEKARNGTSKPEGTEPIAEDLE